MDINGKIVSVLPLQSGESRNGQWKKQEFILETAGQYPRKICFNLWGDKVDQFPLTVNQEVKVYFEVESREYNNRWYTEAKAWKVETASAGSKEDVPPPQSSQDQSWLNDTDESNEGELPF